MGPCVSLTRHGSHPSPFASSDTSGGNHRLARCASAASTNVLLSACPLASPSSRRAKENEVETIQVAGKMLALESTVAEGRALLAQIGLALMAEQPNAVAADTPPP